MNTAEEIFLFGASGHAKVVIDIIERSGAYKIAFMVDDNPELKGQSFFGYPVVGARSELLAARDKNASIRGFVAIGSNSARMSIADWLDGNGFERVHLIHPSAQIGRGAKIAAGTVVMAGAVVNSDCSIGREVIINTGATVDHDCIIGNGVHIAPGVTLCGTVTIGAGAFVCAGAIVIPNLTIGSGAVIGAGATVVSDISDNVLAAGTPARIVKGIK